MASNANHQLAPVTIAHDLTAADLRGALAAGWRDFCAYPLFGLFFAAIYVLAGLGFAYILTQRGESGWVIAAAAGFPLLAPFTAVGLYEVSRRRELGLPMGWRAVLGALRGHGDEQLLMMGGILFVAFSFWIILAHGIFAIFMVEAGPLFAGSAGGESLAQIPRFLATGPGIAMLIVGGTVGALVALAFYAITVVSLPMLVEREVDFLTAIITSLRVMRAHKRVMLVWAVVIAAMLFAAMVPAFLGLLVVLPVLGHATWHLYRRAVTAADVPPSAMPAPAAPAATPPSLRR